MKKLNLILVIFILFIMVSSVIGFIYSPKEKQDLNSNSIDYKGFKFQQTNDNRFTTNYNGNNIIFDYSPYDLENINIPELQFNDKIYLIFDPNERDSSLDYIMSKIAYTLQFKGIRGILACSKEENCPGEIPIKDCNNEAFYFKKDNLSKVYKDSNCVILRGDNINLNKFADKIDLNLIGIK